LIIADAAHRPLGVLAGFADTQANSIGQHLPRSLFGCLSVR
jgi:hypothetical protein